MKIFKGKKEADKRAKAKLDNYVQQDSKRARPAKSSYQDTCGHCKRSGVMSNGKPCRNCGGVGTITRYR